MLELILAAFAALSILLSPTDVQKIEQELKENPKKEIIIDDINEHS